MNKETLNKILEDHEIWLSDNNKGKRANLRSADLRYANLSSANLSSANLSSANLSSANLSSADLRSADLSFANLSSADLRSADLSYADLRYANLSYANLSSADLRYANLSYANLSSANLRSANIRYANLRYADGLTVNYSKNSICEFKVGLYIEANIIYVGCKQHTILEWQSYIESGLNLYENECNDHANCVQVISDLIVLSEKIRLRKNM